jgi:hypothetical protein
LIDSSQHPPRLPTVGEGNDRRRVLVCREVDTNLDGVKDVIRTFNEKGEAVREEPTRTTMVVSIPGQPSRTDESPANSSI